MSDDDKRMLLWIEKEFVPNELKKKNQKLVEFTITHSPKFGTDHFTSHNYFATIKIEDETGVTVVKDIVIKAASQMEIFRNVFLADDQFYNEVEAYNVLMPSFQQFLLNQNSTLNMKDLCPDCICSHFNYSVPEKAVIILENLKPLGFKPAESLSDVDLDHCKISVVKLAKFHAISYAMKMKDPESFNKLKNLFKETRFLESQRELSDKFQSATSIYGIDLILEKNERNIPEQYLKQLKSRFDKTYELNLFLIKGEEPLAVICHGDFCRNNLLYKYNELGEVIDAKLIDFQTMRYASPAFDLSFFIYLNTTQELREQYFDDLLTLYHSTIVDTVIEITHLSKDKVVDQFPLQAFRDDYVDYCLQGYITAAFFLPMMMIEPGSEVADIDFEAETGKNGFHAETAYNDFLTQLNDNSTQRILDMVLHLYQLGVK